MHNDYVNSGELKNTGDPKYTKMTVTERKTIDSSYI